MKMYVSRQRGRKRGLERICYEYEDAHSKMQEFLPGLVLRLVQPMEERQES